MGDKFDEIKGMKYLKVGDKTYEALFSANQLAYLYSICAKNDYLKLVPFVYERLLAGFKEANKESPQLAEELKIFESELTELVMSHFDELYMELMVAIGRIKREVADKYKNQEQLLENPSFLSQITQQGGS